MRVFYIVGDGRSGSTLLESILNNIEGTISVGECFRFWERFYKAETLCGCGDKIGLCELWSKVDQQLNQKIVNYNPTRIVESIKLFNRYSRYNDITRDGADSRYLIDVIKEFYFSISVLSGCDVIIDSSKSPAWAKLLTLVPELEVSFVHLERSLPYVASSWKKKIQLPEFNDKVVFMPVKSDWAILRTWLRIKLLANNLKVNKYLFVKYEDVCNKQSSLDLIFAFLGVNAPEEGIYYNYGNHGIAGNPLRSSSSKPILITNADKSRPKNISIVTFYFFAIIERIANLLLRPIGANHKSQ
jgi:hypothetical protein